MFFSSATAVTGSALTVSRANSAIARSASCSAMTTPNSGYNVALSWWMKLDFLQVWQKPSGYHICVVVAHVDVLMSTDISCLTLACALAFFRRFCPPCDEGLHPQQLVYHQHSQKIRYRLCISNNVQGIWTEKHMPQGIVLLFVVAYFQQTIFVVDRHA